MARISTYSFDSNVSGDDFLIGSDFDENNKTKNYRVSKIIEAIQTQAINAIPKIVNIVLTDSESLEDSLEDINLSVDVGDTPVIFQFFKPTTNNGTVDSTLEYLKLVYLFPLGNGTYEPVSDSISFNELILLNKSKPSEQDLTILGNVVQFDLGDISGETVSEAVNPLVPSRDLTDTDTNFIFSFIDNSVSYFTLFVGSPAIYGLNDTQSTDADFANFTNSETLSFQEDRNIKGSIITASTALGYYDNDADEIDAVVTAVNSLPAFVVEQDFYGIVSVEFTHPSSVVYNNLYKITRGKGSYGTGNTQLTSDKSNIIKIYDGFRSIDLDDFDNSTSQFITLEDIPPVNVPTDVSELNNDSNYATESFVENLVSYRGVFTDKSDFSNVTSPTAGDYVSLLDGSVLQTWIYQNSKFNLTSSKSNYYEYTADFSIDYKFDNSVITAKDFADEITITNPVDGFRFLLNNKTPSNLTITTTSDTSVSTIAPNKIAYFVYKESTDEFIITVSESIDSVDVGTYYYESASAAQTSYTANSSQTLIVDGASSSTTIKQLNNKTSAYNTTTGDIDLSGLTVGDSVDVEIVVEATNVTVGNEFDAKLVTGVGSSGSGKEYELCRIRMEQAGDYELVGRRKISLTNSSEIIFPATIKFGFSENTDAFVKSVLIQVISK